MAKSKTRMLIAIAMLSSISFVLMLLAFPLPVLPAYLKIDFSDIPALIAAITMGPVAGVLVALMKTFWIGYSQEVLQAFQLVIWLTLQQVSCL